MIELRPEDRFAISPSVRSRALDDELILLDLEQGEYLSLNGSGRAVWRAIEAGSTLAAIDSEMVAAWPVPPAEAITMIRDLLHDLLSRGLIARSPGQ